MGVAGSLISESEIIRRMQRGTASAIMGAYEEWLNLRWLTIPSYVVLVVSGVPLMVKVHRADLPWLVGSIVGLVVMVIADRLTTRSVSRLQHVNPIDRPDQTLIVATASSPALRVSRWVRGFVLTGVLLLTQTKPSAIGAFATIVAVVVAGVSVGLVRRHTSDATSREKGQIGKGTSAGSLRGSPTAVFESHPLPRCPPKH
jgi:hypothetical protein